MHEPLPCPNCGSAEDVNLDLLVPERRRIKTVARDGSHDPFDCDLEEQCDEYGDRIVDVSGHPAIICGNCGHSWVERSIVCSGIVIRYFVPGAPSAEIELLQAARELAAAKRSGAANPIEQCWRIVGLLEKIDLETNTVKAKVPLAEDALKIAARMVSQAWAKGTDGDFAMCDAMACLNEALESGTIDGQTAEQMDQSRT